MKHFPLNPVRTPVAEQSLLPASLSLGGRGKLRELPCSVKNDPPWRVVFIVMAG